MEPVTAAVSGSNLWIVAVNLVIWTGLFFLLYRLDSRLRAIEKEAASNLNASIELPEVNR